MIAQSSITGIVGCAFVTFGPVARGPPRIQVASQFGQLPRGAGVFDLAQEGRVDELLFPIF